MILTFYILGKKKYLHENNMRQSMFFFINVRQKIPAKNKKSTFIKKKYSKKKTLLIFFFTEMLQMNLKILLCFNFEISVKTHIKSERILIQILRNYHYITFLSKKKLILTVFLETWKILVQN